MDVCNRVVEVLQGICNKETITTDCNLQNDLALDSMEMVTLLLELEEAFQFSLEESDMNPYDLNTVQDVVDLVNKYTAK